ncbi:MAG: hypothetical protein BAJALOKI2v1_340035 [Promethearchaeota archaeon]|nr:MAG: hypothetical protein BAJALOKI2v1_340035 [Candidatus Lokiarchaeota archaeon]
MHEKIEFNINPANKSKLAYGGFGVFLIILGSIVIIVSILTFWNTLFLIALFFIIISLFLGLSGMFFIIGSFGSFMQVNGESISFRNYFSKKYQKLDEIKKITYQMPIDDLGNTFPINKLIIYSKEGKKLNINLRYYTNPQKNQIEGIIDEIIKTHMDIQREE